MRRQSLSLRFVLVSAVLVCSLAGAWPALAHAALIEAHPADGLVLGEPPASMRLRFNEPVSVIVLRLIGRAGDVAPLAVRTVNETVEVGLPSGLGRGGYALSYRVISADGHPVGGAVTFSVGQGTSAPDLGSGRDAAVAGLLWLSRVAMHLGLFVGAGGAFFLAWFARGANVSQALSLLKITILVGLVGSVLAVAAQGLDALGAPIASYGTMAAWTTALGTSFGVTALIAAAALCAAYASLTAARARRGLALAAMIAVGTALAASGHAGTAGPFWLTRTAVFVHAVAVAYWIGALVPLLALLRHRTASVRDIVRTWSNGAVIGVTALVLTGTALALVQVPTAAALVETDYGRVLLAKLGAVVMLLTLAAANRFWLTPGVGRAHASAEGRLKTSFVAELTIAVVVLGLVGLWRFTPPPRAIAAVAPATVATAHIHTDKAMADVRMRPGRSGSVSVAITLLGRDYQPIAPKEVTFALANPAAGIEPIERRAERVGEGEWEVRGLIVPASGRWQVSVDVLVSDFEKMRLDGALTIAP